MQYDFYEVVKAVVKKVSMVNPGRSNLSKNKVYSNQQEAGFEDIVCGWVDVLELFKSIKSVRKKQIIGYRAMGYDGWEIAKMLGISEAGIKWHIWQIKNIIKNYYTKSGGKNGSY